MKTVKPTKKHARKIVELLSHGLVSGLGIQKPGEMCVEAAVCYALGLPHGDDPKCVGDAVRAAKICLNDSKWSSNKARANGMQRIAVAQLGSNEIDQIAFAQTLVESTIRVIVPIAIRNAVKLRVYKKEELLSAAEKCEQEGSRDAIDQAILVLQSAGFTNQYTVNYAQSAAAYAAMGLLLSYPIQAADCAARSARYTNGPAILPDTDDTALIKMADLIEQALVKHKSPGVKWLDVCNPIQK
jgi:hypothetical protein